MDSSQTTIYHSPRGNGDHHSKIPILEPLGLRAKQGPEFFVVCKRPETFVASPESGSRFHTKRLVSNREMTWISGEGML